MMPLTADTFESRRSTTKRFLVREEKSDSSLGSVSSSARSRPRSAAALMFISPFRMAQRKASFNSTGSPLSREKKMACTSSLRETRRM